MRRKELMPLSWRELLRAGEEFDKIERTFPAPTAYDRIMLELARSRLPDPDEVMKIYTFMNRWFSRVPFSKAPDFCKQFAAKWNILSKLSNLSLEDASMETPIRIGDETLVLTRAMQDCFDAIDATIGSTPASKALHVAAPGLFVMWDKAIAVAISKGRSGYHYANIFMPAMREHLEEVITSYMNEKRCDRSEAIRGIQSLRGRKYTLAKMIDEFNWVTITKELKPTRD
jgi:hypothetical protein